MFLSLKDKDKTVYTHTSLIDDDKAEAVRKVHQDVTYWNRGFSFFTLYLSLELVNRVHALAARPLWQRALIVAIPPIAVRLITPFVYWRVHGNNEIKKLANGAPVFDQAYEVPELDKMYFFLDDDNNYEPSLWHHGITKAPKPKQFYSYKP